MPERFGSPDDPLVQFLQELKSQILTTQRHERLYAAVTGLFLVGTLILVGFSLYIRGNDLQKQNNAIKQQANDLQIAASKNRAAIRLLCRVSTSFDNILVSAADQIELNLLNGTYDRLLKQGVVTQSNIDAAKATLHNYRTTHKLLENPQPCKRLERR